MKKILEDHPAPWKVIDGRSHDARGNVFECDESTHQLDFMVSCVNWFARVSENKDDVCTIMQDRDELRLLLAEASRELAEKKLHESAHPEVPVPGQAEAEYWMNEGMSLSKKIRELSGEVASQHRALLAALEPARIYDEMGRDPEPTFNEMVIRVKTLRENDDDAECRAERRMPGLRRAMAAAGEQCRVWPEGAAAHVYGTPPVAVDASGTFYGIDYQRVQRMIDATLQQHEGVKADVDQIVAQKQKLQAVRSMIVAASGTQLSSEFRMALLEALL